MFTRTKFQIDMPLSHRNDESSVHLDLGGGDTPRNPFNANLLLVNDIPRNDRSESRKGDRDATPFSNFLFFDLSLLLPIESSSLDSISAYDVIEHIPRWERLNGRIVFPFVQLMDEIFRCLKPGGMFLAVTPYYPKESAFQDPTHVNFVSKKTIEYFCRDSNGVTPAKYLYGSSASYELILNIPLRGPGPYLRSDETLKEIKKCSGFLRAFFSALSRLFRLKHSKQVTHLYWILKKPDTDRG